MRLPAVVGRLVERKAHPAPRRWTAELTGSVRTELAEPLPCGKLRTGADTTGFDTLRSALCSAAQDRRDAPDPASLPARQAAGISISSGWGSPSVDDWMTVQSAAIRGRQRDSGGIRARYPLVMASCSTRMSYVVASRTSGNGYGPRGHPEAPKSAAGTYRAPGADCTMLSAKKVLPERLDAQAQKSPDRCSRSGLVLIPPEGPCAGPSEIALEEDSAQRHSTARPPLWGAPEPCLIHVASEFHVSRDPLECGLLMIRWTVSLA